MNCPNCNATSVVSQDEPGARGWRRPRIARCSRCRGHFDRAGIRTSRDASAMLDFMARLC